MDLDVSTVNALEEQYGGTLIEVSGKFADDVQSPERSTPLDAGATTKPPVARDPARKPDATPKSNGWKGRHHTAETRARIGAAARGRAHIVTEETRQKIRDGLARRRRQQEQSSNGNIVH